ncbi:MAG: hypothetical protein IPM74_06915 [Crocinitomicaceae bacterium]|nr:hypothetical protein [Crocinitomicaceae bacterium]
MLLLSAKNIFATAQYGDLLIEGNDTSWIYCNPLEEYFEKKGSRSIGNEDFDSRYNCTALWRGYVATWLIENDSLFLVRIQSNFCSNPLDVSLIEEFGTNKVFAHWVNFSILKPEGEMLQYIHAGYMSIFEGMSYIEFLDGIQTGKTTENYLDRNKYWDNLLFTRHP